MVHYHPASKYHIRSDELREPTLADHCRLAILAAIGGLLVTFVGVQFLKLFGVI